MSRYAWVLVRNIERFDGGRSCSASTRGDMHFRAMMIISGYYDEPYGGVL